MVILTLKALIVLAGLGSRFSETWGNNFILHWALLLLTAEALNLGVFGIISTGYPGTK